MNERIEIVPGTIVRGVYSGELAVVLQPTCRCCHTVLVLRTMMVRDWDKTGVEVEVLPVINNGIFEYRAVYHAIVEKAQKDTWDETAYWIYPVAKGMGLLHDESDDAEITFDQVCKLRDEFVVWDAANGGKMDQPDSIQAFLDFKAKKSFVVFTELHVTAHDKRDAVEQYCNMLDAGAVDINVEET